MNFIDKLMTRQAEALKESIEINGIVWETAPQEQDMVSGYDAQMITQLERDQAMSLAMVDPMECWGEEQFVHMNDKIAGKTLDQIIDMLPNVHYTCDQILSFIYKFDPIVESDNVENVQQTKKVRTLLHQKNGEGISNQGIIEQATKHALLYGRAGIFKKSNGEFEMYRHDRYTVVIGYRKNDTRVQEEILGYILYNEGAPQAVLNMSDVPANFDVDWFKNSLNRLNQPMIYVERERMRFIPFGARNFVNLRYDTVNHNPRSRLYKERLRISDSVYLHEALNRKFRERGIGRLVIETANDMANTNNGQIGAVDLINQSSTARKVDLETAKKYYQYLANTIKRLDDDDVLVLPEGLKLGQRLENTNTPDKYLKMLSEDQNIVPLAYGVPPTLFGLGTLSDRNISIQAINETTEDTSIGKIRRTFYDQISILFGIGNNELTNAQVPDIAKAEGINKDVATTAMNLAKAGVPQDFINTYVTKHMAL